MSILCTFGEIFDSAMQKLTSKAVYLCNSSQNIDLSLILPQFCLTSTHKNLNSRL